MPGKYDKILIRLKELPLEENRLQKYTVQLRILSQLRNLQTETNNQINHMALKIDIRKDPVYQKGIAEGKAEGKAEGIAKGIEEKSREIVINLLKNTSFTDEKIALLTAVSLDFIREIRKSIKK